MTDERGTVLRYKRHDRSCLHAEDVDESCFDGRAERLTIHRCNGYNVPGRSGLMTIASTLFLGLAEKPVEVSLA